MVTKSDSVQARFSLEQRRPLGRVMSDSGDSDQKKSWMSSGPSMYRHPAERLPMDLFSYTREAGHSLRERRFLACIAMASTAVEIILNRDRRLRANTFAVFWDGRCLLSLFCRRMGLHHSQSCSKNQTSTASNKAVFQSDPNARPISASAGWT
jgi:hypothetical protein